MKGITIKQKEVFKEIMENRGSISQAMIKCGYSKATAKNPKNLTDSLGWKKLIKQYLPDEMLQTIHLQGLKATKNEVRVSGRDKKGNNLYEYEEVIDYSTRHKYLNTAYKLKNKFPKKEELNRNIAVIIRNF